MVRTLKALFNVIFRRREVMRIKELHYADDKLDIIYADYPGIKVMAKELGEFFIKVGGTNFVQISLFDPATMATYDLTIQKRGRYFPSQVISQLRAALEMIQDDPSQAEQIADAALKSVGYLE